MRIAKLYMDPQDKQRFEIQGKSSVKYHLKANHQVEAKRWYWALNNAIQWSKDEAREEEKRAKSETEALQQAKMEQMEKRPSKEGDTLSLTSSKMQSTKNFTTCKCNSMLNDLLLTTSSIIAWGSRYRSGHGLPYCSQHHSRPREQLRAQCTRKRAWEND